MNRRFKDFIEEVSTLPSVEIAYQNNLYEILIDGNKFGTINIADNTVIVITREDDHTCCRFIPSGKTEGCLDGAIETAVKYIAMNIPRHVVGTNKGTTTMKKLTTDIIKNIEGLFPDVRIDIEENTNEIVIKFTNGNSPTGVKVTISGDNMFNVCLWRYVKDTGSISTGEIVDMHYGSPEVRCRMTVSETGVFVTAKVVYFLSFC